MSDFFFKIHLLFVFLVDAFINWKREVWARDLDQAYCCNGRECACNGSTVREMWTWMVRRSP